MNVVANWRDRARALRAEYWRCENCGRFATVRRAACTGCGNAMATAKPAGLPASLKAIGFSHRHIVVETMDQVSARGAVMLAQSDEQLFALPLCETDVPHGAHLIGEMLELVLRRKSARLGSNDPIAYTRKLAASAATRVRVKANAKQISSK